MKHYLRQLKTFQLLAVFAAPLLFTPFVKADVLTLENDVLQLSFNAADGTLSVLDKRNDYTWRQDRQVIDDLPDIKVTSAQIKDDRIHASIDGGEHLSAFVVWLDPYDPAAVQTEVHSKHGEGSFAKLPKFPYPFVIERENGYIIQCTTGDGVIFAMDEVEVMKDPFNFTGGMPWYGVTDLEKGCIGVLDSFQHSFLQPEPTAKFPMQVRFRFFTEGGFVSMAKYYRNIAKESGKVRTLAEKATLLPDLKKMIGAPIIYLWGTARSPEMIQKLQAAGVDRAAVLWDLNHAPGPTAALVNAAVDAGYVCGPYDIYLAIMNPATAWERKEEVFVTDRRWWPEGWPHTTLNYQPGVAPVEFDHPESAYVCSTHLVDWARDRIREELRHYNYSARFFDTMIPQVRPCDSPLHPLSLEGSRNARLEILRFSFEDQGQITGSGEGYSPDWAVPVLSWMEGAMSMRYYTSDYNDSPPGDWQNGYAPTKLLSVNEPDDTFWDFEVNPARRLPLYGLVYHDSVMTTWNWRGSNHRWTPEGNRAKDLMNMLFGTKPLWSFTMEVWEENKESLMESYRMLSPWLRKVEMDNMTDYRHLSEDGMVAMSSFESGWNIAVNMSDASFDFEQGNIPPMDYIIWQSE